MIISASRRTDIPAFYSEWFLNRLREEYAYVRNPFNANQIAQVNLKPENVDCIVFWTKSPGKIIRHLKEIDQLGYQYYFQFTLNSYNSSIERSVPKKTALIDDFKRLSDEIGKEKVIWRYDPIFFSETYSYDYHIKWYEYLIKHLSNHTQKCIFSFIDMYEKCKRNLKEVKVIPDNAEQKFSLAKELSNLSNAYGLKLESCAQEEKYQNIPISHGKCIDDSLVSKICNFQLAYKKDKHQRLQCRCVSSIDIGTYNTCKHFCRYCYANYSEKTVVKNTQYHDPDSPLITGRLTGKEKIIEKNPQPSSKKQLSLF